MLTTDRKDPGSVFWIVYNILGGASNTGHHAPTAKGAPMSEGPLTDFGISLEQVIILICIRYPSQ